MIFSFVTIFDSNNVFSIMFKYIDTYIEIEYMLPSIKIFVMKYLFLVMMFTVNFVCHMFRGKCLKIQV